MTKQSGFSLIEISIVLLIIALISGGVMYGTTLIRNAELQTIIKEHGLYTRALGEFTDKYSQLPGDFSQATTMWGTDADGCPDNSYAAAPSTSTATCNGDGNGRIGTTNSVGDYAGHNEWYRAWQHLSNAGFIDGRYTGQPGSSGSSHTMPGINVPASQFPEAGWTLIYYQLVDADNSFLYKEAGGGYGHLLFFGAGQTNNITIGPIMTPMNALELDRKMDDGYPGTGKMRAPRSGTQASCTGSDSSQTNQAYKTGVESVACSVLFLLGI